VPIKRSAIVVSIAFGALYWVVDAVHDWYFVERGAFWDILILDLPPHEIVLRTAAVACFIVFGVWVSNALASRDRAQLVLRESQRAQATLLSNLPGMAYRCNNDRDWTMEFVSEGCLTLTGYNAAELIGNRRVAYGDLIVPDDREEVWNDIQAAVNEKNAFELVYRIHTAGGMERWVWEQGRGVYSEGGELLALEGFITDITERQQAEAALCKSVATLRGVFEAAPIGIGLSTRRVIDWANEELVRMTGYAGEELRGRNIRMLYMSDEEYERIGALARKALESGEVAFMESCWRRKEGGAVDVMLGVAAIDANDASAGMVFTALDISERKRSEQERETLEAQVRHAQKLESLGVLAGGIAHDFNNLLVGILGNADLALEDLPQDSPARETIKSIEAASMRAAELTKQMLAYSGRGRFIVERFDLSKMVAEMMHLLEASISKKVELRCDYADRPVIVEADATQMRQVIMNLITNASDALGDDNGVVELTTGVMDAEPGFLAGTQVGHDLSPGQYAFAEVSDNGCGMDDETKAKIFDPFFTTKFTGRGLGLAATLGIVRGHGGAIKVESEPGSGTRIRVLFPFCADETSELATESPAAAMPREAGEGMILVVDDEDSVRSVAQRVLESSGYTVLTAVDGRDALKVFKEHSDEISLALLDMTMPHLSGEEVFREMRRIRDDVPVVLSSGFDEQEAVARFSGQGLAGFIQKPYRPSTLLDQVYRILAEE